MFSWEGNRGKKYLPFTKSGFWLVLLLQLLLFYLILYTHAWGTHKGRNLNIKTECLLISKYATINCFPLLCTSFREKYFFNSTNISLLQKFSFVVLFEAFAPNNSNRHKTINMVLTVHHFTSDKRRRRSECEGPIFNLHGLGRVGFSQAPTRAGCLSHFDAFVNSIHIQPDN